MPVLTIISQKGGVGKTTTAGAMAQAAAFRGLKCLAIDLDAQGNLSFMLGADKTAPGSYEFLSGAPAAKVKQSTGQNIDVIAGNSNLASLKTERGAAYRLDQALKSVKSFYDLIIIDTPAKAGILQYNALQATDHIIITLWADSFSVDSLYEIQETLDGIRESNPDIKIAGVLITMYESNLNISKQLSGLIRETAEEMNIPFLGTIRKGAKVKEAIAFQESLFTYAPNSNPAKDYLNVFDKVLRAIKKKE